MNIRKIVSMVLSCAVLAVSVLSVGASAVRTTVGPFYASQHYASGVMMYKYTTVLHSSSYINMTLDGKCYINKISMGSDYAKEVNTYACIYKGFATDSRFNDGKFFNGPETNKTLNKGKIIVKAEGRYYPSGARIMEEKTETEVSTNWVSVRAGSMQTSKNLSSYGYVEYECSEETLFNYVSTSDY